MSTQTMQGFMTLASGLLLAIPTAAQDALAAAASVAAKQAVTASRMAAPPTAVVDVEVFPTEILLPHRYASAQVLVTAVMADGTRKDVTREIQWHSDDSAHVDARGAASLATGYKDRLSASFSGRELELPIAIANSDNTWRPRFAEHVQPILTRLGCSTGSCHGAADGQNGFVLSLRGYDWRADHRALTDDLAGRRFDPSDPEQSLFLLKPTGGVPHEGGKILDPEDPDYAVLRAWLEGGADREREPVTVTGLSLYPDDPTLPMPADEQQFAVHASFSDGSRRDVTQHAFLETANIETVAIDDRGLVKALRRGEAAILARYQGVFAATRVFVMGNRDGYEFQPESNRDELPDSWIDDLLDARLEAIRALPSESATDAEFLRRIHLDLTGLLPTVADVRTFALDRRQAKVKRAELVERLLGSTAFVEHWTARWANLLQVHPKQLSGRGVERFDAWLRGQIASNRPYDEFVRDLIASSGSTWDNPPAAFYKVHREPDAAMEATTQLFLGTRFNCNKCHDHPFEKWTQGQHWQLAAMFADTTRKDVDGRARMRRQIDMAKGSRPPTVEEHIGDGGKASPERAPVVKDPNGREHRPGLPFEHAGALPEDATYREQLAAWLTAPENPLFAKSYVNRVWSYLLGRGLIDPVDDIRAGNPPSHPQLLQRLTDAFVAEGFDARQLIRTICNTRAYQRSVAANKWNEDDTQHFARAIPRRLEAEVLFDAVHRAAGRRPSIPGTRPGTRARDLIDPTSKAQDGFLDLFGRPARTSVCECEREQGLSLGQALSMVNGPTFAESIKDPDNELAELARFESDPDKLLEELYARFFSRAPTASELEQLAPSIDINKLDAIDALPPEQRLEYITARDEWANNQSTPKWHLAEIGRVTAKSGIPFKHEPDGSVVAGGKASDKDEYTVSTYTDVWPITGIRIEALPDDSLPKKGPGRNASGNFVLGHVRADVVPLEQVQRAGKLTFTHASADFSQQGYPAKHALTPANDGWAIHPQPGKQHVLVLETEAKDGDDAATATDQKSPTLVLLRMTFPYGSQHVLGRFRVSVTSSPRPVRHAAYPEIVAKALRKATGDRTDAEVEAIHRHYLTVAKNWVAPLRLAVVQDMAWSLANSPAFLFNR